jgi:hypothetical protein
MLQGTRIARHEDAYIDAGSSERVRQSGSDIAQAAGLDPGGAFRGRIKEA